MNIRSSVITVNLALLCCLARPVGAEDLIRYSASLPGAGSWVKIEGTSTLHDWTMESKLVPGSLEIDPKVQFDPAKATLDGAEGGAVPLKAKVRIPIRALKSHATAMDNVCQDAMEAQKFPFIEYDLSKLSARSTEHKPGTPFELEATGNLIIHGVTNHITMPVTIERVDDSKLRIKGSESLKMSSFGVKPPSPAISLGAIKTGDDVKVSFEWLVIKRPTIAKAAEK